MDHPLAGLRVVEISRVLTGAYCSMVLGDLGADVVKVERPDGGDESRHYGPPFYGTESYYYMSVNRNKRSVTLDLSDEDDRSRLSDLVGTADVLVHNYLPDQAKRLGFAYEALTEINPSLIYCAISAFGASGQYASKPALDIVVQAAGGAMSITGTEDGVPLRTPVPAADLGASVFAAYAILAAYLERLRTGLGQRIDVSLLHSLIAFLPYHWGEPLSTGTDPLRRGNSHPTIVPYDCYKTSDGYVVIAVNSDQRWLSLCNALSIDGGYQSTYRTNVERVRQRAEVDSLVQSSLEGHTTAAAIELMELHGVPCSAVNSMTDVITGSATSDLEIFRPAGDSVDGPLIVAPPFHLSNHATTPNVRAPALGQHTSELDEIIPIWRSQNPEGVRPQDAVVKDRSSRNANSKGVAR